MSAVSFITELCSFLHHVELVLFHFDWKGLRYDVAGLSCFHVLQGNYMHG